MAGTRAKPPVPVGLDPRLKNYLESLQESVENGEGRRGKRGDRWIREDDLVRLGIARYSRNASGNGSGSLEPLFPVPDTSKPPIATGLEVSGVFTMILIRWNNANRSYGAHAMTEIWRANEDDRSKAVIIGQTIDSVFSDGNVVYGQDYYYWIRWVSEFGEIGLWNAVGGTVGRLSEDPSDLLARLEGEITESQLYEDLNERINLIDSPGTGLVSKVIVLEGKSETSATQISQLTSTLNQNVTTVQVLQSSVNGVRGQYTVKIDNNGYVAGYGLASTFNEFDNRYHSEMMFSVDRFAIGAPGRGSLAFVVDAANNRVAMHGASIVDASIGSAKILNLSVEKLIGNIGEFVIANIGTASITSAMIDNQIQSTVYVVNRQGWAVNKNGFAEFQNIRARGDIEATSIKANAANIVDTIHINGKSVTSMYYKESAAGLKTTSAAWTTFLTSDPLPTKDGMTGFVIMAVVAYSAHRDYSVAEVDLVRNGTVVIGGHVGASIPNDDTVTLTSIGFDPNPGVNPTYSLRVRAGVSGVEVEYRIPRMVITGGYR